MPKPERSSLIALLTACLVVTSATGISAQEEPVADEATVEQPTPSSGDEEPVEDEEPYEDERPVLPEDMTLDEVLDHAQQTPDEEYPNPVPDDQIRAFLLADQLEYRYNLEDQPDHVGTELQGWVGGDYNRLWLKVEGEAGWQGEADIEGETESDLMYGRLITPFWNAQVGAQFANEWTEDEYEDIWSGALALQGLAPGMFEVDLSLYLTENVNFLAALEVEYDIRITQRLLFQPRTELSFSAQDIEERGIGVGLTSAIVDLRLRYEILREFAPYLGARFQGLVGETADLVEAAGGDTSRFFLLGGLRFAIY